MRRRRSGAERGEDSSRSWEERSSRTSIEPKRTSIFYLLLLLLLLLSVFVFFLADGSGLKHLGIVL